VTLHSVVIIPLILFRDTKTTAESKNHTIAFVALKILTTAATVLQTGGLIHEEEVFEKINSANPTHPGFLHCIALHETIWAGSKVTDPIPHLCYVMEPMGTSLYNLLNENKLRFSVSSVKRIIKQVLLALDYLHRECGYIHAGSCAFDLLGCSNS
jgi:serine/threonine-protein kinase SRPK3